jgi:hypothetical protein
MWEIFFNNRELLTWSYTAIISVLFFSYGWLIFETYAHSKQLSSFPLQLKICLVLLLSTPFVLASNALSYDVFNYIFNAKMVTFYQANPHVSVALDFANDPWTRFMHNTHTPAPYGYGWTVLSLLPFSFGFGKLLITWLNFKLFSWLAYLLLAGLYTWYLKKDWWKSLVLLANPLLLIEIIGNSHNDLWMLVPAVCSLILVSNLKLLNLKTIAVATALLMLSISIKLATVVLVPLFIILLLSKIKSKLTQKSMPLITLFSENWPLFASLALFVPLFLERSKWFLPWYISWPLVFIPLIQFSKNNTFNWFKKLWISILIGFSISSLYRYLPFLLDGNYAGQVIPQQIAVTWLLGIVAGLVVFRASA